MSTRVYHNSVGETNLVQVQRTWQVRCTWKGFSNCTIELHRHIMPDGWLGSVF